VQTPSNIPKHLSYSQAYDISLSGTEKEKMKMKKPLMSFFLSLIPFCTKQSKLSICHSGLNEKATKKRSSGEFLSFIVLFFNVYYTIKPGFCLNNMIL
jgi:hypothetical protein